jgi:hypothetical protein
MFSASFSHIVTLQRYNVKTFYFGINRNPGAIRGQAPN